MSLVRYSVNHIQYVHLMECLSFAYDPGVSGGGGGGLKFLESDTDFSIRKIIAPLWMIGGSNISVSTHLNPCCMQLDHNVRPQDL